MRYRIVIEKIERHEVHVDAGNETDAKSKAQIDLSSGKIVLTIPLRIASIQIVDVHRSDR